MEENIHRPTLHNSPSVASFKEGLRVIRHRILRNKLQEQGVLLKPSSNRTMVFAPHADDETLGCGGFIALKHDLRAQVEVVILTDGSACFGSLPPADATALVERREREAERAVAMLGVPKQQLHFLRQPDGRLSSLGEGDRNALLAQLIELLERYSPQEVLVPHRLDNTPDHETTFHLVHLALKATSLRPIVLQYPIWRFWSGPLLDVRVPSTVHAEEIYRLEISQVLEKKRKAFSCYESQYLAVGEFSCKTSLPARFQKAFELEYEVFFGLGDT